MKPAFRKILLLSLTGIFVCISGFAEEHPFKSETLKIHKKHPLVRNDGLSDSSYSTTELQRLWEQYQENQSAAVRASTGNNRSSEYHKGVLVSE
ncbi:MAG: hypothetical protein KC649_04050 [Candidatus Omnitrophica bacterium]|nr:hypothetical protein [Candidatus Omnitrophota bacterium]